MKQALIYNELVRFYNRSRRKLHTLAVEGKNLRKQDILKRRIVGLFKTLMGFQRALKLGMATSALSAGMLLFQPNAAKAQISFDAMQLNPFGLTGISWRGAPAFADLDGDGDMDLIGGDYSANFNYFENTGTALAPAFAVGQTNPFGLTKIGVDYYSSPAFTDLDGDGDMDLMTGELYGFLIYYQNTGTSAAPAFAAPLLDPFGLTNVGGSNSTPAFVDLDQDGDMDMMVGEDDGNFTYFENTGTYTAPSFAAAQTNPFGLTDIGFGSAPAFADLDAEGDMDMMSGEGSSNFVYSQNTGTAAAPAFAAAQTNPFGLTATSIIYSYSYWSHPAFADLDGDGDMDMMASEYYGRFFYFENTTPCNGLTVYADADGDHYGDSANSLFVTDCIVPGGYVISNLDCDDNNAAIHPGACDASNGNGVDDNCDGAIDNGFGAATYYTDEDGDGYGAGTGTSLCSDPGAGYSTNNIDCDDSNGSVYPGTCDAANSDGVDDNCDGVIDDGFGATTYYTDADGDGYGTGTGTSMCSNPGAGYSTNSTDCDDGNASVYPGATEATNGIDDNCNGIIDDVVCPLPSNLSVVKVTGTSAKLKWDAVAQAEGYMIRYKVANTSGWKYGTTYGNSKPISGLLPNTLYKWEIKTFCQIAPNVTSDWSSKQTFTTDLLRIGDESVPQTSFQIYPNPAEDHATIQFTLPQSSHVCIKVCDVSGKEIANLFNDDVQQGDFSMHINTNHFSKGVYLVKMISEIGIENQKLIVQ